MSGAVRQVRLGRLFERRKILGFVEEPMLSVFREHGVVLKDAMVNHNQTAEDRSIYQLVEPGWLAVNRMKAWQGALGISQHRGIMSGHYICFAPRHGEEPRYLHYALRSPRMTAHFLSISRGVRPGQIEIDNDQLAATPIPLPPLGEQRRIAGFIDDRVARIDQIIAARRAQISAIRERWSAELERVLNSVPDTTRASRLIRVLPGFAFPSSEYSTDEADRRLLRGINLGVGSTRWDEVVYWPEARVNETREFVLDPGDVVIGMDRPWIGEGLRIAQVTEEDAQPLLLQRVAKISSEVLMPDYLYWAYQSRRFRDQVEADLTGLSVPHLSGDQIGSFEIPVCDGVRQAGLVSDLASGEDAMRRVMATLGTSIELLGEYKQSLITAAVTGELDVTTAGSGVPG